MSNSNSSKRVTVNGHQVEAWHIDGPVKGTETAVHAFRGHNRRTWRVSIGAYISKTSGLWVSYEAKPSAIVDRFDDAMSKDWNDLTHMLFIGALKIYLTDYADGSHVLEADIRHGYDDPDAVLKTPVNAEGAATVLAWMDAMAGKLSNHKHGTWHTPEDK